MDIPSEVFGSPRSTGSARGVCEYTHLAGTTGRSAQCVTLTPTVCWKFLRARYVNLSELLLGYLHTEVCLHMSELLLGVFNAQVD